MYVYVYIQYTNVCVYVCVCVSADTCDTKYIWHICVSVHMRPGCILSVWVYMFDFYSMQVMWAYTIWKNTQVSIYPRAFSVSNV